MIKLSVLFTEKIRRQLRNLDGEIILLQNSGNINELKATQSGSRAIQITMIMEQGQIKYSETHPKC